MGTYYSDDFEAGRARHCRAKAPPWWWISRCPAPVRGLGRDQMWDNKSTRANCDYSFHMAITWWGERCQRYEASTATAGDQHAQAFYGLQGGPTGERRRAFASFRRCGELGAIPPVSCREWRYRGRPAGELLAEGNDGPEGHADRARPRWRARPRTGRQHRGYGRSAALRGAYQFRGCPRGDPVGEGQWAACLGEPLIQHLTLDDSEYAHPDWDHAARRVTSPPFRTRASGQSLGRAAIGIAVGCWRRITAPLPPSRSVMAWGISRKDPNGQVGLRTGCRCSGPDGVGTGRLTPTNSSRSHQRILPRY